LSAALESLAPLLKEGTPIFGLIGEAEAGFLSAALIAGNRAGYELNGLAMPTEGGHTQISWRQSTLLPQSLVPDVDRAQRARSEAQIYFQARGEPSRYLNLHATILEELAKARALAKVDQTPAEDLSQFNSILEEALTFRGGFLRYGGSEKALDVGYWWLRENANVSSPLSDRVEEKLVHFLIDHPDHPISDLYDALSASFPGLLTPSAELIHICLESYGEEKVERTGAWHLHPQNSPSARQRDLDNIRTLLNRIADTLGFQQTGELPMIWQDELGNVTYAWYVITSAILSDYIFKREHPSQRSLIVFPGGRANLVALKIQNDPRLRLAVEEGWRLIKFRQIRWLAENPVISRDTLDLLLAQDLLTYESPQMRFF
jgi:hypothetical protein